MKNIGFRNGFRAAGTAAVAVLLSCAAWKNGLFFDADAYAVELWILAATAAVLVWGIAFRGAKSLAGATATWGMPLGMAACYAASLLAGPASHDGTVNAMLRWIAYAGWAAVLALWWRHPHRRAWGEAAILGTGLFLLAGGWLGWFGLLPFPDIVLYLNDPELSETGARLGGFLQYPNAYGALAAFFLVRQWQLWAGAGKAAGLASSILSIPYAGLLLLTESRGALAAMLLGFGMALALGENRRVRARLVMAAAFTAVGAAAAAGGALRFMAPGTGSGPAGGSGIWLAAGAMAAGAAGMYALRAVLSGASERRRGPWAWVFGAALSACAAAAAIAARGWEPGGRLTGARVETGVSRLLFYRDSWPMFRDAPWLGHGGDSWRKLFGLYQSRPYVGGEVHSGYLEILLDTGLLGLLVCAGMIGYWMWKMRRTHRAALAPASVLLVHAAVDFDLSYGFVWLLLIAWVALFTTEETARRPEGVWRRSGVWGAAALLVAASAWGLAAAWQHHAAARAAAAADAAASPAAREELLRAALSANPADGRIRLALAALLPQAEERASVLAAGLRFEPQSAPLLLALGLAEAERGRLAQAETRLREALRLERYNREAQTAAIAGMSRLAEALRFSGDAEAARRADAAAVAFYEEYRRLADGVQMMVHPSNGRRFAMTDAARFHAAVSYARLGRTTEAEDLLAFLASQADSAWREQAQRQLDALKEEGADKPEPPAYRHLSAISPVTTA